MSETPSPTEKLRYLIAQGGYAGAVAEEILAKYSPGQERDDHGRFAGGDGGESSGGKVSGEHYDAAKDLGGKAVSPGHFAGEAVGRALESVGHHKETGDDVHETNALKAASKAMNQSFGAQRYHEDAADHLRAAGLNDLAAKHDAAAEAHGGVVASFYDMKDAHSEGGIDSKGVSDALASMKSNNEAAKSATQDAVFSTSQAGWKV